MMHAWMKELKNMHHMWRTLHLLGDIIYCVETDVGRVPHGYSAGSVRERGGAGQRYRGGSGRERTVFSLRRRVKHALCKH